ncbi:hypothetical protein [Burkholderia multivorans]|uniref:hypothetical protein n=1 Tax=Burkholderia multivorans TaxID=87883 RepID=UPI0021BECEAB|nr:hypothetical protein [Burkholderia multivorans]
MTTNDPRIANIIKERSEIIKNLDNGDITCLEALNSLEKIHLSEIEIFLDKAQNSQQYKKNKNLYFLGGTFLALGIGFFASPHIYPKFFGYSSAEACAIETKTEFAARACYAAYPSITSQKDVASPSQGSDTTQSSDTKQYVRQQPQVDTEEQAPVNGEVVWYNRSGVGVAPFQIKTPIGSNYLVKLSNAETHEDVLNVYVIGGTTANIKVPLGRFTVKYASGDKWYGYKKYFGQDTVYAEANTLFDFTREQDGISGYSITLYKVPNGNLHMKTISAKDFD